MVSDVASVNAQLDHCVLHHLVAARRSLKDSLDKTSQLRDRLITSEKRLQGIVCRLPLLQQIMDPLQDRARVNDSVAGRIDEALERVAFVLDICKAIQAMAKNLEGDPKADLSTYVSVVCCLERYIQMLQDSYGTSLNWLEDAVVFLKQMRAVDRYGVQKFTDILAESRRVNPRTELLRVDGGVLHIALQKLETEFERLLVDNSRPMDLNQFLNEELDSQNHVAELSFSPVVIGKLLVIMDRLKSNDRLQVCLRIYKEYRSVAVREGMSSLAPIYLQYYSEDAVDMIEDWNEVHDYIFSWVKHLKIIVKVVIHHERELCRQVFQTLDPSERGKCLEEILQHSNFSSFFPFSEGVARSHHRSEALLIGILDLFKGLADIIKDIGDVPEDQGCLATRLQFREAQKPLINNAWRVYLEFVKTVDKSQTKVPMDGGKDKNASFVVNYMGMLMRDYETVLEQVLGAQAGAEKQQQSSSLSVVVLRVMSSLERSLENRAAQFEDAALAHIFLMNNYRHVLIRLKELLKLADCLGAEWKAEWQRKVDQNLRNYTKKGWAEALRHLNRDGLSGSGHFGSRFHSLRETVKTRLRAFNAAFEDAYNKQCRWVILDPQLRDTARIGVTQLLHPAYSAFLNAYGSTQEEAGPHRSIKYSPDVLLTKLDHLFEGSKPNAEKVF